MVLEDYGEMMFLQTVLKKIGFDVDAIQNPRSFEEHLLRMNPDLLLMTAHGKKVHGLQLAKTTKKVRGLPYIILLHNAGAIEEDIAVNRWLPSPTGAVMLLDAIADVCGLNKQILQEKFQRLKLTEAEAEKARVLKPNEETGPSLDRGAGDGHFGVLANSTMSDADRKSRYQKFLSNQSMPTEHGYSVKQVQEQVKALRKDENAAELEDLERERRLFVEHLFKKKA